MRIGEVCTREVVFCTPDTSVSALARLMRQHHVGSVVVVEERAESRFPIGVLTDRDIVVEIVALDVPPQTVTAGDLLRDELVVARETEDVYDALQRMQQNGIRRMPVVDAQGALIGIVALDDLLEILSEELGIMVRLVSRERQRELKNRPELVSSVHVESY